MTSGAAHRILVVDDEPSIVDAVATALRYEGYQVAEALTGRDALAAVAGLDPDLVVLDWMLSDLEGIEVGRRLRERGFRTAVLFLTAKDGTENKVEALRAGGDDYVTKPFSLAEIVARVQAILRRTAGELPGDVLRFGDLVLDEGRHEVHRGETRIELTATEFNLLRYFMLNPRRALSKLQITRFPERHAAPPALPADVTVPGGPRARHETYLTVGAANGEGRYRVPRLRPARRDRPRPLDRRRRRRGARRQRVRRHDTRRGSDLPGRGAARRRGAGGPLSAFPGRSKPSPRRVGFDGGVTRTRRRQTTSSARRLGFLVAVAAAALLTVGVVAASAHGGRGGGPLGPKGASAGALVTRAADQLGVTRAALVAAIEKAAAARIDEAVEDGDLDEEDAADLKEEAGDDLRPAMAISRTRTVAANVSKATAQLNRSCWSGSTRRWRTATSTRTTRPT